MAAYLRMQHTSTAASRTGTFRLGRLGGGRFYTSPKNMGGKRADAHTPFTRAYLPCRYLPCLCRGYRLAPAFSLLSTWILRCSVYRVRLPSLLGFHNVWP